MTARDRGAAGSPALEALRRLNRATSTRRRLRRVAVAAYTTALRVNVFLPPPRVVLNGPAKAGTHLLSDCLSLLPRMMFSGRHFVPAQFATSGAAVDDGGAVPDSEGLDVDALRRFLARCPQGMFVTTHAGHRPELAQLHRSLGFRHVLLVRDPRDIAVSLARYITSGPWLPRHRYFTEVLRTDGERLMATITGYRDPGGHHLADLGRTLDTFLPWLDDPGTLVVRFEDLVGPKGGGTSERQVAEVQRVAAFVGRPLDEPAAAAVAARAWSRSGPTFRLGRAGSWRDEAGPDHVAALKEVAGRQLIALGYEDGLDW